MNLTRIESHVMYAYGYDEAAQTLRIVFPPTKREPDFYSHYNYGGVTPDVFQSFVTAESKGSFFLRNIKNSPDTHPYARVSASASEAEQVRDFVMADMTGVQE